jgi:hypothetical protein
MHPKALTGRRGARSVYNFGRILTDRIDSQSARKCKRRAYGPPFYFGRKQKRLLRGNDPERAPAWHDSVTCQTPSPDRWTHLPALSTGDRTRRQFHLTPFPLDVDQRDRAAHPSFERTGNGSCKAGFAPRRDSPTCSMGGTEPWEKPCFSSPADADMDTVASSSRLTGP